MIGQGYEGKFKTRTFEHKHVGATQSIATSNISYIFI